MRYFILFLLGLVLFFAGCDNKTSETKKIDTLPSSSAGKIEVVENDNFKEEKVALKAKDANESKVFYYDYNDEKKATLQNKGDEKNYTPVGAALSVRSPYEHVEISLLVNKLSKNFMVKCSACHDDYANGIIGPSLLNKDNHYIYKTIIRYKTGEKSNVLMNDLVKLINDKEIQALADEIYTFNQEIKKIKERKQ